MVGPLCKNGVALFGDCVLRSTPVSASQPQSQTEGHGIFGAMPLLYRLLTPCRTFCGLRDVQVNQTNNECIRRQWGVADRVGDLNLGLPPFPEGQQAAYFGCGPEEIPEVRALILG